MAFTSAARALVLSLVLTAPIAARVAQGDAPTQAQRVSISSLIDGTAKTIHVLAWPTATY